MKICIKDTCNKKAVSRGYCKSHYNNIYYKEQNKKYNKAWRERNREKILEKQRVYVEKNREEINRKGREWAAANRKNPVTLEHFTPEVAERFWAKVDKTDTCWNWTSAISSYDRNRKGYGTFTINKRPFYAHRLSKLVQQGYLTEGLVIDHICENTLCVNPEHLREVTNAENILRSPKHTKNHGGYRKAKAPKFDS